MASASTPGHGRARQSTVFFVGCLLGCVLSTMLYVWVSGALYSIGYGHPKMFEEEPSPQLRNKLSVYLSAIGNMVSPIEKRLGYPSSLSLEYRPRKVVMRAVLTSRARLNATAQIINETWGSDFKEYFIFVGGSEPLSPELTEKHPIKLLTTVKDIGDNETTTALAQTFTLLKVLYQHYKNTYKWFLIIPDNTYVASNDMEVTLSRMDSEQLVYMGRPGSVDPLKMAQVKLISNEFYCQSGPGIILSSVALAAIVPHLDDCLNQVNVYAHENQLVLDQVDVELGRCFSRKVDTRCSSSREAINYFVNDSLGLSMDSSELWYNPKFSDLLSLHPIKDHDHMRSIHHYVTFRQFHTLSQKLRRTKKLANEACRSLPFDYRMPVTENADKSCSLDSFNSCNYSTTPLQAEHLPNPFSPLTKYELQAWNYFDPRTIYTSGTTVPSSEIFGENEAEIQYILKKAVQAINQREAEEYKFQSLVNGYMRYSATRGREYILDLMLAHKYKRVQRRVNILRVHQPELLVLPDSPPESATERVNMIIPLSSVNDRFKQFLSSYENFALKTNENMQLILAVFGGLEDQLLINKSIMQYRKQYPVSNFTILIGEGQFSRGRALNLGMSVLNDSELAFLCDVDMTIDTSFLDRCRLNTIQGKRVYYPEFFKYYNMDYVYRFKRKPSTFNIRREHGHWATYSYGMVCMYKSDYSSIGGFDTEIYGWGGEDVDLFMKVLNQRLQVLKSPDPALSHRYHEKHCGTNLTPIQFRHCLSSRNEGIADRMQLAEYVLYLEDKYTSNSKALW